MSLNELGSLLNLKPSYIKYHWNVVKERYEKRGIFLYKLGRGEEANYGVKLPWESEIVFDPDELDMI